MKKFFLFSTFVAWHCIVVDAQKHDNIWLFGYDYNPDPLSEGIRFRFDDSLTISYEQRPMDIATTSACLSDSAGNLLLYSNGCYVANAEGNEVEGSTGLNSPGTMYNIFCAGGFGYGIPQGMLSLPDPARPSLVYFLHFLVNGAISKNLMYTLVDTDTNNGKGGTVAKNQPLVLDTIAFDGIHAVKHANGRDWWVIAAKEYSNKYYLVLLSPGGLSVQEQSIGEPTWSGAGGQMVFSPDGARFARFNTRDDLRVFDFDRCTGELSNPVFIPMDNDANNNFFAGLAWSADGRYLYAGEVKRILQFDTWADDIASTMTIVAERPHPLASYLAYLELGPDGYIYGKTVGADRSVHRIKYPERGDVACEVQQSYYVLEYPFNNLPHFPNYRLGPLDGSPCDTLGLDNRPLAGWRCDKTGGLGVDFTSVSWYEPQTWHWDFGDPASGGSNQSGERNPSHEFSAPGAYEVCLRVANQYGSDTKCRWVWVATSGLSPLTSGEGSGARLYPNPSTGILRWSGLAEGAVRGLRVYDALGRLCLEREKPNGPCGYQRLAGRAVPRGTAR
jgi:FOG: PKD repeat